MNRNVDFFDGFIYLKDKSKKLIPIIKEYDFESIVKAVFAIVSWRNNRGAQESCLALNNALCSVDDWGRKNINTYEEFSSLFDKARRKILCKRFSTKSRISRYQCA